MYCRGNSTLEGCVFTASGQGALYVSGGSQVISDCTFTNNSQSTGGAVSITGGTVSAVDSLFTANTASSEGGAVYAVGTGSGSFVNCAFSGNSGSDGGAAAVDEYDHTASLSFTNCVFTANHSSSSGAAIYASYSSAQATNCSFAGNVAGAGGVICAVSNSGSVAVENSVLWDASTEISVGWYASVVVNHSCVRGGYSGTGNIAFDPLFVDGTDGGDGFDLRLQGGSPCINMGTDTSGTVPASASDMAGVARPQGPAYDMGAYEYATAPVAAFSASPATGVVPLAVTFADASTSSAVPVTGWAWDFGDGGVSAEQNPAHTYSMAGVYAVSLTAKTVSGNNTVTKLHYINVGRGTPEVMEWPALSGLVYGQPLFESSLTGGAASVAGTFGFADANVTPNAGTYFAAVIFTPADLSSYNPVYGTVALSVAQAVPGIMQWPTADDITYGQALSASALQGGQSADIGGQFAFDEPSFRPDAGTYSATVIFTPFDAVNYAPVSGTVDVNVAQAAPAITTPPTATAIALGQRVSSALLLGGQATVGSAVVAGTFAFTDPSMMPEASGSYPAAITFAPADTLNYLPATGTALVSITEADCPECGETTGPYNVGGNACLVVPGTFSAGTSFTWSRQDGAPLDGSRSAGIYCRRLQIAGLEASDAGTYLCTYGDGANVDVYSVTIVVNEPSQVPALPHGGKLAAVIALIGLAITWRYRQTFRV